MNVIYFAPALDEIDEALSYYRAIQPGLPARLEQELRTAIRLIERFPQGWHPLSANLRQHRLKSFPYMLIYGVQDGQILIVAFANTHRRPGYWRNRLRNPR